MTKVTGGSQQLTGLPPALGVGLLCLLGAAEASEVVRARQDPALEARITEVRVLPDARSASALLWVGQRLLVVQDSSAYLVLVDPRSGSAFPDPLDAELAKLDKPDYEAAFALPDGRIIILGSGSKSQRRVVVTRLRDGTSQYRRAPDLFALVEDRLGANPNIEGAVLLDGRVQVFHRGVGAAGSSASLELPLSAFEDGELACSEPQFYDLGRLGGAVLGFSDVTPAHGGALLFLAAAEDTDDPVADGDILGAAVGVIDAQGVRWTPLLEPDGTTTRRKPEGIVLDGSGLGGWLVTDPDDAAAPASLLRFRLDGPWPGHLQRRGHGPLSLRLEDIDPEDVLKVLEHETGQGFVAAGKVGGHLSVDLRRVSLDDALAALGATDPTRGAIRRVYTPPGGATGPQEPVSLSLKHWRVEDLAALYGEIEGRGVDAPVAALGLATAFATDVPPRTLFSTILDTAGLTLGIDDERLLVERIGNDPAEASRRLPTFRGPEPPRGLTSTPFAHLQLVGFSSSGGGWTAWAYTSDRRVCWALQPGQRLLDAEVVRVDPPRVVIEGHVPSPTAGPMRFTAHLFLAAR